MLNKRRMARNRDSSRRDKDNDWIAHETVPMGQWLVAAPSTRPTPTIDEVGLLSRSVNIGKVGSSKRLAHPSAARGGAVGTRARNGSFPGDSSPGMREHHARRREEGVVSGSTRDRRGLQTWMT